MDIRFRNKKLREMCEQRKVAVKVMGAQSAQKLGIRLAALEAARCVSDLVAGRPHELTGPRAGQLALDLSGGWRLVFSPDNEPRPERPDGGIDWQRVTIVCIEYIGDYHD